MKTEAIDFTKILKGLEGKWVVISDDLKKVLKASDNIDDLDEVATQGYIMKVPDPRIVFVPTTY
jgi:hypothetical protein